MSARRALGIWLLLFAVYGTTLGLDAAPSSDYGAGEAHQLLVAESLVSDGDLDLTDEYRTRAYDAWYSPTLQPAALATAGHIHEPPGAGFGLLIAPAYAVAGPIGVELMLAAIAALAFVLAIALARRLVPDPWATAGPLVVALSPPALAHATTVTPELTAGALLAGAALAALRVRDRPRGQTAALAGLLVAALPWLDPLYLVPGAVVLLAMSRWLVRLHRGLAALVGIEITFASLVLYVSINGRFYGSLTPYAAALPGQSPTDADFPGGYADRAYRLIALWFDADVGLLRWSPFLAMAFFALWLLWRSRRDHMARAVPDQADVEVTAALLASIAGAQIFVAAFLSVAMFGPWFPAPGLIAALPVAAPLAAWGLRHAPRVGAVLAAITLAGSLWLILELRLGSGGLAPPDSEAPWGPLVGVFPAYRGGSAWGDIVIAVTVATLVVLGAREWHRRRQSIAAARQAPAP